MAPRAHHTSTVSEFVVHVVLVQVLLDYIAKWQWYSCHCFECKNNIDFSVHELQGMAIFHSMTVVSLLVFMDRHALWHQLWPYTHIEKLMFGLRNFMKRPSIIIIDAISSANKVINTKPALILQIVKEYKRPKKFFSLSTVAVTVIVNTTSIPGRKLFCQILWSLLLACIVSLWQCNIWGHSTWTNLTSVTC